MTERDFQSRFTRWAKHHIKENAAFELKLCKSTSLPFDAIAPHQIENLMMVRHRTLFWKISDMSLEIKPFDCFALSGAKAYLVIMFYRDRGDNIFYMIEIDDFIRHKQSSKRKSLTLEDTQSLACMTGELKSS